MTVPLQGEHRTLFGRKPTDRPFYLEEISCSVMRRHRHNNIYELDQEKDNQVAVIDDIQSMKA